MTYAEDRSFGVKKGKKSASQDQRLTNFTPSVIWLFSASESADDRPFRPFEADEKIDLEEKFIELFLKSDLLKRGFPESDLRKYDYRHNLNALLGSLQTTGAPVAPETVGLINGLHSQHQAHGLRYSVFVDDGRSTFLPPPTLLFIMRFRSIVKNTSELLSASLSNAPFLMLAQPACGTVFTSCSANATASRRGKHSSSRTFTA